LNKLDDFDPPLAALIFGHETLVPSKSASQFLLAQIGLVAGRNQQAQKLSV
jgi:hypothetical protein